MVSLFLFYYQECFYLFNEQGFRGVKRKGVTRNMTKNDNNKYVCQEAPTQEWTKVQALCHGHHSFI